MLEDELGDEEYAPLSTSLPLDSHHEPVQKTRSVNTDRKIGDEGQNSLAEQTYEIVGGNFPSEDEDKDT
jgi:hypothetical protein